MTEHEQLRSLSDAWLRYEAHVRSTLPPKKAAASLAQTRTALLRYTLPGWGFPLPKGSRLTEQECEQGLQFLTQITLERLQEAPHLQEGLFEQIGVAGNSRRNYRWALNAFIDWCKQQDWFNSVRWSLEKRSTPRQREKKGSATAVRTTPYKAKTPYQLSMNDISSALQQELESFNEFLVRPEQALHNKRQISVVTAKQTLQQVLRFLGWRHQVQGIAVEDLSLYTLFPAAPDEKGGLISCSGKAATTSVVELVQAYLQWLQASRSGHSDLVVQGTLSPHTVRKVLDTWLAVARFVHRQELAFVGWKNEETVPAIVALRNLRRDAVAQRERHRPISNESKRLVDWTEFLDLVEKLRAECSPWFPQKTQSKQDGTTRGSLRSLTAIAQSYQRFLCAALLAYLNPQRQQELRQLKVSFASDLSLEPNPSRIPQMENLLYRHGKQWLLRLANRKHRYLLDQPILVPNLRYADGRCFYQYLEEWLLYYDHQEHPAQPVAVLGLRNCFKPQHDYMFTLKNGQPYSSAPAFMALLRNPIYRLTGKTFTPQAMRQMFITHIVKTHNLSSVELKHLAHIMEHPYKALAQQYEATGLTAASLSPQEPEHEDKEVQGVPSELKLQQEDRQWATEIAQAFLDEKSRGESQPQKVVSAALSFP